MPATFSGLSLLSALLSLIAAPVCILTLAGFYGKRWWVFDLANHFRAQYLLLLFASAILFWIGGQYWAVLASAGFGLVNLILIVPLYLRNSPAQGGERVYRLLLANVLQSNRSYSKVVDLIRSVQPDFIVLVETNQAWLDGLREVQPAYPYTSSILREDNYGVLLLSRFLPDQVEVLESVKTRKPTVALRFCLDGRPLTIIGTHPAPPKGALQTAFRNRQLETLAATIKARQDEVILCGDFNLTPWSPFFHRLLHDSGLKDSARGFGVQPTWPSWLPIMRIPIDHCLISPRIIVHGRAIGSKIGSDHLPVILDFSLKHSLSSHCPGSAKKVDI